MFSRQELIDAIERADSIQPPVPGIVEYTQLPGVLLRVSPMDDPHFNEAIMARFSASDADEGIDRVTDFYRSRKVRFSWIVGPSSSPADLGVRLLKRGFEKIQEVDGLFLPDLNADIAVNEAVRIVELSLDDLEPVVHVGAVGFGTSEEASRAFNDMVRLRSASITTRVYIAFLDGVDYPIACGYTTYYPDQPIALLCGGATIPEFRGRGVYRSILAHRLSDIRRDGFEAVIIQADQETSSPICVRNGFEKVCEFQVYKWESRRDQSS